MIRQIQEQIQKQDKIILESKKELGALSNKIELAIITKKFLEKQLSPNENNH